MCIHERDREVYARIHRGTDGVLVDSTAYDGHRTAVDLCLWMPLSADSQIHLGEEGESEREAERERERVVGVRVSVSRVIVVDTSEGVVGLFNRFFTVRRSARTRGLMCCARLSFLLLLHQPSLICMPLQRYTRVQTEKTESRTDSKYERRKMVSRREWWTELSVLHSPPGMPLSRLQANLFSWWDVKKTDSAAVSIHQTSVAFHTQNYAPA